MSLKRSLLFTYVIGVTSALFFICWLTFGRYVNITIEFRDVSSTDEYLVANEDERTENQIIFLANKTIFVDNASKTDKEFNRRNFCGLTIKKEMDLLKMKKLPFLSQHKNPCWRKLNGPLRCIPYMYLVGVAKCGTTDLFSRITKHPDFQAPSIKEPNWLSAGRFWRNESLDFYSSKFFSSLADVLEDDRTHTKAKRMITGEASINTITGAHAWQYLGNNIGKDEPVENNPEYIHHIFNETKILINIRNPVDRLWSEYLAFSKSKIMTPERFHAIVEKSIRTYNECMAYRTLRSCIYDRKLWNYASMSDEEVEEYGPTPCAVIPTDIVMLQRGVYHVFIQDYLHVFRRDHVLIQRLEDISEDPKKSLQRTYTFLGLRQLHPSETDSIIKSKIKNTNKPGHEKTGSMLPKTRRLLYQFYKPHNEILAKMLHDKNYNYGPSRG